MSARRRKRHQRSAAIGGRGPERAHMNISPPALSKFRPLNAKAVNEACAVSKFPSAIARWQRKTRKTGELCPDEIDGD